MQDRYVGDIGDFVKFALLRALSSGRSLGVAWYLHPDEGPRGDGRHTDYLKRPDDWRSLDEVLFDSLKHIVAERRCVASVQEASLLKNAVYSGKRLDIAEVPWRQRTRWRKNWFEQVRQQLACCDLVFADPDNGLVPDERLRPTVKVSAKRIPVCEVRTLAGDRPTLVYHHNTRRKGGHRKEIAEWQRRLPGRVYAYYWRRWSNRTFFLLNGDENVVCQLVAFAKRWHPHGELIDPEA